MPAAPKSEWTQSTAERQWSRLHPTGRDLIEGAVVGGVVALLVCWALYRVFPEGAFWWGAVLAAAYVLGHRWIFDPLPPHWPVARRANAASLLSLAGVLLGAQIAQYTGMLDGLQLPFGTDWGRPGRPVPRFVDRLLVPYLTAGTVVTLIGIWWEVQRIVGAQRFLGYVFGVYQKPQRVRRLFLFVDLDDATAHAERLGPEKTFELLADFYHAVTGPVEDAHGAIYQYVGDQVVAEWVWEEGVGSGRVLRAVAGIHRSLARREESWQRRFGCVPRFKAGLHGGDVLRAEVGTSRRDFVYSGDVLNTAQRIQASCHAQSVTLLVSAAVAAALPAAWRSRVRSIGEVTLKGRQERMELFALADEVRQVEKTTHQWKAPASAVRGS